MTMRAWRAAGRGVILPGRYRIGRARACVYVERGERGGPRSADARRTRESNFHRFPHAHRREGLVGQNEARPLVQVPQSSMATLHSASASGASARSCSALWAKCALTVPTSSSASSHAAPSTAIALPQRPPTTTALSTTVLRPRPRTLVRDEDAAVRAAEERIACMSHVGPHAGPGSGAGLNYTISKLRGRLERLETWRDGFDTSDDEEEAYVPYRGYGNRMMTYG